MNGKVAVIILASLLIISVLSSTHVKLVSSAIEIKMNGALHYYIVDLDGVGGVRAANHSAVVDGAMQASYINYQHELYVWLYAEVWPAPNDHVLVKLNITYTLVRDWQAYRQLVETAENTIIVNTHDEILPVPEGYTKEEWTAQIADFVFNRWGTWVHTGGLPFRAVRYENGFTWEWLDGFKKFMQGAGLNVTIENPPLNPNEPWMTHCLIGEVSSKLDFFLHFSNGEVHIMGNLAYAVVDQANAFDYCLKYSPDYVDTEILRIYGNSVTEYIASTALKLPREAKEKYGVFVFSSPWKFYYATADPFSDNDCSIAMGAVPTAGAIWCEAGYAALKIAKAQISKTKDGSLMQNATEAFNSGNYKQAVLYAEKATALQQQPDFTVPAIVIPSASGGAIITAALLFRHNKGKKREGEA